MRRNQQDGIVSLIVTMIMMIVISLIVIGIAQVTRHNSRESVDQQLSAQAYYAAETGINDAVKYLQANPLYSSSTQDWSQCDNFYSNNFTAGQNQLDGSNVAYTCLLVNTHPPSLQQSPLNEGSDVVWPLIDGAGKKIKTLTFAWKNDQSVAATKNQNCPTAPSLPAVTAWKCSYPILRVDLTRGTSAVNQSDFTSNTATGTVFMHPSTTGAGSNTGSFSYANKGTLVTTKCNTGTKLCTMKLTMPNDSTGYYARIATLYGNSDSITVTGTDTSGAMSFTGGQAVIDATGRAQDELRRVQVHVPLNISGNTSPLPQNALQGTGTICKLLSVEPGKTTDNCVGGGGSMMSPAPPPGGDAAFETCINAACTGSPSGGGPPVTYWANFRNRSNNPVGSVSKCLWDFGDAAQGDPDPTDNTACNYGDTITHVFYPNKKTPPYTCIQYTVKLTVFLKNGTVKQDTQTVKRPAGTSLGTCF